MSGLIVAKLGGSLSRSPLREGWLEALAGARGPLILVPGGGPFAREVRAEQIRAGFDDVEAHGRALIAMERFGALLAEYSNRFVLAASRTEIGVALAGGKIPVWLPTAMALAAPEIPPSWDATSDTLAAWLAGALGARSLLLIKSVDVERPVSLPELTRRGVVDPLFAHFAAASGASVYVAGPAALPDASRILREGGVPGAAASHAPRVCLRPPAHRQLSQVELRSAANYGPPMHRETSVEVDQSGPFAFGSIQDAYALSEGRDDRWSFGQCTPVDLERAFPTRDSGWNHKFHS